MEKFYKSEKIITDEIAKKHNLTVMSEEEAKQMEIDNAIRGLSIHIERTSANGVKLSDESMVNVVKTLDFCLKTIRNSGIEVQGGKTLPIQKEGLYPKLKPLESPVRLIKDKNWIELESILLIEFVGKFAIKSIDISFYSDGDRICRESIDIESFLSQVVMYLNGDLDPITHSNFMDAVYKALDIPKEVIEMTDSSIITATAIKNNEKYKMKNNFNLNMDKVKEYFSQASEAINNIIKLMPEEYDINFGLLYDEKLTKEQISTIDLIFRFKHPQINDNILHYEDKGIVTEPLILEPDDWSAWQWSVLLKLFGLKEAERIKVSDYHLEFYGIEKDRSVKEDPNKLDESIRRHVIIKTQNHEEEHRIASKIHDQLVGNPDYVDNRIVLNMSSDRLDDDTKNEIHLYIFNDSESDPEIKI